MGDLPREHDARLDRNLRPRRVRGAGFLSRPVRDETADAAAVMADRYHAAAQPDPRPFDPYKRDGGLSQLDLDAGDTEHPFGSIDHELWSTHGFLVRDRP